MNAINIFLSYFWKFVAHCSSEICWIKCFQNGNFGDYNWYLNLLIFHDQIICNWKHK